MANILEPDMNLMQSTFSPEQALLTVQFEGKLTSEKNGKLVFGSDSYPILGLNFQG